MKRKIHLASVLILISFYITSNAQMGSLIAPTQVTIGVATAWQPKYATGVGIGNQTDVSLFDFLAKDREKPGFRLRDNLGAHTSLGLLTHPDVPTISTGTVTPKGSIWYDVGFNVGLQALFGFNKDVWISLKGQMVFSFNNAAYYEHPFPTSYYSKILTGGLQIGPIGFELGKGWAENRQGPNFLTLAGSFELNEKPGKSNLLGVRYSRHGFYEYGATLQENYFFSVFYAFCI